MQTTITYTEKELISIKDRISSTPNKIYFLEKDKKIICFPPLLEKEHPISSSLTNEDIKEKYARLAIQLDKAIDKISDFFGKNNVSVFPYNSVLNSFVPICFENEKFEILKEKYHYKHSQDTLSTIAKRSNNSFTIATLASIKYNKKNEIKIHMYAPLQRINKALINTQNQKFTTVNSYDEFMNKIDFLKSGIDKLFTQQGFEPNETNRVNLLSLAVNLNKKTLKTAGVKKMLGITDEDYTITNPNLIKAAVEGYNDALVRLCYIHNYYPKNSDELQLFTALPYESTDAILGG